MLNITKVIIDSTLSATAAAGTSVLKHHRDPAEVRPSTTRNITTKALLIPTLTGEVNLQLHNYIWHTTVL